MTSSQTTVLRPHAKHNRCDLSVHGCWHGTGVILDHSFFHLDVAETDRASVKPKVTDL